MGNIVMEALANSYMSDIVTMDYHGMALSLKKGLNEAVKSVSKASTKIKTKEELYAIAYNSYNNETIAKLIADTVFKIGKDGVLSIEDSKGTDTTIEVVNGLEIQKGYHSPYLTNNQDRDKAILENPAILIANRKIHLFHEIAPIIKSVTEQGIKGFVVIADGFGDDVISKCVGFKMMGAFQIVTGKQC